MEMRGIGAPPRSQCTCTGVVRVRIHCTRLLGRNVNIYQQERVRESEGCVHTYSHEHTYVRTYVCAHARVNTSACAMCAGSDKYGYRSLQASGVVIVTARCERYLFDKSSANTAHTLFFRVVCIYTLLTLYSKLTVSASGGSTSGPFLFLSLFLLCTQDRWSGRRRRRPTKAREQQGGVGSQAAERPVY